METNQPTHDLEKVLDFSKKETRNVCFSLSSTFTFNLSCMKKVIRCSINCDFRNIAVFTVSRLTKNGCIIFFVRVGRW